MLYQAHVQLWGATPEAFSVSSPFSSTIALDHTSTLSLVIRLLLGMALMFIMHDSGNLYWFIKFSPFGNVEREKHFAEVIVVVILFFSHTRWYSGPTTSSVLGDHTWLGSGDYMQYYGSNIGWPLHDTCLTHCTITLLSFDAVLKLRESNVLSLFVCDWI